MMDIHHILFTGKPYLIYYMVEICHMMKRHHMVETLHMMEAHHEGCFQV